MYWSRIMSWCVSFDTINLWKRDFQCSHSLFPFGYWNLQKVEEDCRTFFDKVWELWLFGDHSGLSAPGVCWPILAAWRVHCSRGRSSSNKDSGTNRCVFREPCTLRLLFPTSSRVILWRCSHCYNADVIRWDPIQRYLRTGSWIVPAVR